MSLKPNKKSDLGKSWNKPRRDKHIKMQLGHHLIITEGEKTEPLYFDGLKKAVERTNRTDRLQTVGTGSHTTALIEIAKRQVRNAGYPFEHVWLVYDKDDFPSGEFNRVIELCAEANTEETTYHAIWSNQCIELWYLLHFSYFHSDIHRDNYFPKLSDCLRKLGAGPYEKNRDDMFEILRSYIDTAILNSEKLEIDNCNKAPANCAPGTMMHVLIKFFKPYL